MIQRLLHLSQFVQQYFTLRPSIYSVLCNLRVCFHQIKQFKFTQLILPWMSWVLKLQGCSCCQTYFKMWPQSLLYMNRPSSYLPSQTDSGLSQYWKTWRCFHPSPTTSYCTLLQSQENLERWWVTYCILMLQLKWHLGTNSLHLTEF